MAEEKKTEAPTVTMSISDALLAVRAAQTGHGLEIAAKLDELRDKILEREMLYPSGLPRALSDLVNVANITAGNLRAVAGQ